MGFSQETTETPMSSSEHLLTASESLEDPIIDTPDLFSYEVPNNDTDFLSSEEFYPTVNKSPASFSQMFGLPEYAVFVSVLVCSAAIGVFYGLFRKGQQSTEEYLMGNRRMSSIPVALSLLCSFVSAITVLGNPVEIYFYGSTYGLILVSFIPMTLSLAYCYVPVYHNLQLTSAYEYLELRFSRYVRVCASLLGIIQYVIYMAIVVYGPALALRQVTGIPTRVTSSIIFIVCIFYSTLGGLKAVLWTDSLQAVIMIGSLTAIVIKGILDTGGFEAVWSISMEGNRTHFFNFDPDPRTRHTVWTSIFGGYFMWLANFAATHSQVQRYLAIPTLIKIRRALLLNFIGLIVIFGLCYLAGLALFARYHLCDPVQAGAVSQRDQLLPLFVMETLGHFPGFPGLFVAGVTCASLSSVSSGLNSLAAILTYDYIKQWFPHWSDATLLRLSKAFCVIFGCISFGFVFVAEHLGNILPLTFSLCGGIIGPILGVFSLGLFFPWTNSKGALMGLLSSVGLMTALIISKQIIPSRAIDQTLPGLSIEGCPKFDYYHHHQPPHAPLPLNMTSSEDLHPSSSSTTETPLVLGFPPENDISSSSNPGHDWTSTFSSRILLFLTEISYMWYPALGCTLSVTLGLIFSFLFKRFHKSRGVNPDYLSPPALWLLTKLFPNHIMNWIEVDGYPMLTSGGCSFTLSVRSDFSFNKESMCDMKLKRLSVF
ncbi:unnamed protein product [Orchesella dallaii]|uniref:Sodium-coupled monocarboxylate transporter 1 n=1 Tax=Orchesella dallaii TaxID=48710 RepID=A0ABP1QPH1_9HEXA